MPYTYHYRADADPNNPDDEDVHLDLPLTCRQCEATVASGAQCKARVCIGLPFCHAHSKSILHLRIGPSLIEGAGKGLFAFGGRGATHDTIVFRPRDHVVEYMGELITRDELYDLYGDHNAHYSVAIDGTWAVSAEQHRGIGSTANHGNNRVANCRLSANTRERKVSIKATKIIRHGDELLANYGNDFRHNDGVHSTNNNKFKL